MLNERIKTKDLIRSQIPNFIFEEGNSGFLEDFLTEYYNSVEYQGGPNDLLNNIDQYVKLENISELNLSTKLSEDVLFDSFEIFVDSTVDFPSENGIVKINDEIIFYQYKDTNSFKNCTRAFSGTVSYTSISNSETFLKTSNSTHNKGDTVYNLRSLFLYEFFKKFKNHFAFGFEEANFYEPVNETLFLSKIKDFYSSKGSDNSFDILFRAVFGVSSKIIKPRDYLIRPSDSDYRTTRDIVVEQISGDPENLVNLTLFQDEIPSFIPFSSGTVTKVEKLIRLNRIYYRISLDYSPTVNSGSFDIHPKTFVTSDTIVGQPYIDVDSTNGFEDSGKLLVYIGNNSYKEISYTSKSSTQFLGCSETIKLDRKQELLSPYYAYAYNNGDIIKVRVTGVLSTVEPIDSTYFYDQGDKLEILSLGSYSDNIPLQTSWLVNCTPYFDVLSVEKLALYRYRITTTDDNTITVGDSLTLSNGSNKFDASVIKSTNKKAFDIQLNSEIDVTLDYVVTKNILKVNCRTYGNLNTTSANVNNVYDGMDGTTMISSPSLPNYLNNQLIIKDFLITINGFFDGYQLYVGKHPFFTGDNISYHGEENNNLNIPNGSYYVKKIDDNNIKLATSRSNIFRDTFVYVNGSVTNNTLKLTNFANQTVRPQKLLRKFYSQLPSSEKQIVTPGQIGMFVNGVEALSYKTGDFIFYGKIENIDISSVGDNEYDVINPPNLLISDPIGFGATGVCNVTGSLRRIDLLDKNYSFTGEIPRVTISGGNGTGAKAECIVVPVNVDIEFGANSNAGLVNISSNTIGFTTFHRLNQYDKVIYQCGIQTAVGGLLNNATYHVSVINSNTIKLYPSYDNAVSGINTVDLTSYGNGIHKFRTFEVKNIISSIEVINGGEGYSTKKLFFKPEDINLYSNNITIQNHNYQNKEIVTYNFNGTQASGISTSSNYFVKVIDKNNIRLSLVGVGTISEDYYYDNNLTVKFTSQGLGVHELNYLPIVVTVDDPVGIITFSGQNSSVELQPIFRGSIQSISLSNNGQQYGDQEIINYKRQPVVEVLNGSDAVLTPIVSNGSVVDVLINNPGSNYNSTPSLSVLGDGLGCVLIPIIKDGKIDRVIISSGGVNYTQPQTRIYAIPAGSGVQFDTNIKSWNINLVERIINTSQITDDDGVVANSIDRTNELEYCHAYAPRKLRESLLSSAIGPTGETIYRNDLSNDPALIKYHSPVLGWAYDGNPIYGPYGYSDPQGGAVRRMISGYKVNNNPERPSSYPVGFFIEDYIFTNDGDLDVYNGRYCKTPEYPNGVYAYFTTVNGLEESDGPFRSYLKPQFPYIIGNYYECPIIPFNYDENSNENKINLNDSGYLRNTYYYHLLAKNSGYDCIIDPTKNIEQKTTISDTSTGSLTRLSVVSAGSSYRVGDVVSLSNNETGGRNASAVVDEILGKNIVSLGSSSILVSNVEFSPTSNRSIVGVCTLPHNFVNAEVISITNLNNYEIDLSKRNYSVGITTHSMNLSSYLDTQAVTGIVTFVGVYGNLNYPNIRVGDIYNIGNEKIKILEINKNFSQLKILRGYDGTSGVAHTQGSILFENPRKFTISFNSQNPSISQKNTPLNKLIYFNPEESLGRGSGVGIGTTIFFSHVGYGITQLIIPVKSIYLRNHELNTGDSIIYSNSGNTSITVSTGSTTYPLTNNTKLYVGKINDSLIGISTLPVGVGSTGSFVNVGTNNQDPFLSFTDYGSGFDHLFTTDLQNTLQGDVIKTNANVITEEDHNLNIGDIINLIVYPGITTSISVQYNDANRRMVMNPKSFTLFDVDTNEDTILIPNHGYKTGHKVLHISVSSTGGLFNDTIYYVIVVDRNRIRLSDQYYGSSRRDIDLSYIDLTSPSFGVLWSVNPEIKVYRNNTVTFDLSDLSLSSSGMSAFTFDFYTDREFKNKFYTTDFENFSVKRVGNIGIDANASVTLIINSATPPVLYYKLTPIVKGGIPQSKSEIILDDDNIDNNNTMIVSGSLYCNTYAVVGVGSTSIKLSMDVVPETDLYNESTADMAYFTQSGDSEGPISFIKIITSGNEYSRLPSVLSVTSSSGLGTDALLLPFSNSIGKVNTYTINDIGFDYPSDKTLSPVTLLPKIFKIEPLSKFESIKIVSPGVNYFVAPQLIALDGLTGRVNTEVDLRYNVGDTEVTIVRNTRGVYNLNPIILPINNPNGVTISSINFNNTSYNVTVGLAVSFGSVNDFPFEVGDRVIVENTNIDLVEGGDGYNCENYDYKLFTLTSINPDIGGESPTITFNLSEVTTNPNPGIFDSFESIGTVTPEKYFPVFDVTLVKDKFITGEVIKNQAGLSGIAQAYDYRNEYLKLNTTENFQLNDFVTGESSKNSGLISEVTNFRTKHIIGSNSIINSGWKDTVGNLNDDTQRVQNNDYYQEFSYSINSTISYEKWNSLVSTLNHTLGFKKFSDLSIESYQSENVGFITTPNNISLTSLVTLDGISNINTYKDFDICKERSVFIGDKYVSNQILFTNPFLTKYNEFIGNRVLKIDDVSSEFNYQQTQFTLKHNGSFIFSKEFDATVGSIVGLVDNTISLPNHFFVTGEEIEYIPFNNDPSNSIGIGTTYFVGVGTTSKLPSSVYVIKIDTEKVQLASSAQNALLFNPIPLSLTSVGTGKTHIFRSKNTNTRALITLNGIIQSPLVSTAVTTTLSSSVGIGSTIFGLSGITSIFSGDLIKVNNEIMFVNAVGSSSTNSVNVLRGHVGTSATSTHSSGSLVTKLVGNYNIIGNTINFPESVPGLSPIGTTTSNNPNEVDYLGITTSTRFDGRVFIRSALKQGYTTTYDKAYNTNYVFDDISQSFNGISTSFTLKVDKSNVTGFSTSNAMILINDIFQGPRRSSLSPLLTIPGDYTLEETSGKTDIIFTGSPANFNQTNDINASSVPRGGIIVSVGSSSGLRYQPLVGAGGTCVVSVAGTIQSVAIGNSGSGYRVGVQTYIRVGVQTYSSGTPNITYIGYANAANGKVTNVVITNPGFGYTQSNPPQVVIDEPLNYTNIPLIYSQSSPSGIGTGATVDITVGQGSSVINFELKNLGYGYGQGDILTVPMGGTTGIPTDSSTFTLYPFKEFNLFIDKTYNSKFSGWSMGDILVLDDITSYFNGRRRIFPLSKNGQRISFFPRRSSGIDLEYNLLIFINDVLQKPGESYTFTGGSVIRFNDPPNPRISGVSNTGDVCKLMIYTGTQSIDVIEVDVIETLKVGDDVKIFSDVDETLSQNNRTITLINSADTITTNTYSEQGVSSNELLERPINWTKQTEDKVINDEEVGKDRTYYEPNIHSEVLILNNIGIGSTFVYVSSVKSLFDNPREGILVEKQKQVEIISNDNLVSGIGSAIVSVANSITSITVVNPGFGYTSNPTVVIQRPEIGNIGISSAIANVSSGVITSFTVTNPGFGYTTGPISSLIINQQGIGYPPIDSTSNIFTNARLKTLTGKGSGAQATIELDVINKSVTSIQIAEGGKNYSVNDLVMVESYDSVGLATTYRRYTLASPIIFKVSSIRGPLVLVSPPTPKYESVQNVNYQGDYGIVVGVGTTNVGISTGIIFDFYIPSNSPLVTDGHGISVSGIKTGDYFIISNSSVGYGITSLTKSNSVLGIGTQNIDNVYEVYTYSQVNRFLPTIGISTTVVRVITNVKSYNGLNTAISIASTDYYATYSWGKINFTDRTFAKIFTTSTNLFSGISSNPIIRRKFGLAYQDYYI